MKKVLLTLSHFNSQDVKSFLICLSNYTFFVSYFLSKACTDLELGSRIIASTVDPRPTGIQQENVTIVFSYNEVIKFNENENARDRERKCC